MIVTNARRLSLIILWAVWSAAGPAAAIAQDMPANSWSKQLRRSIDQLPFDFSTSVELRNGLRTNNRHRLQDDLLLGELRWQLNGSWYGNWAALTGKVDLVYDYAMDKALTDTRELNLDIYPQLWWSLKIGRQMLTWGKGDLVFINDLFPKDFPSFFSGRDIQYLKAPSDAVKLNIHPAWIQINIIYVPRFDPDRFPTGARISFYDDLIDDYRGADALLPTALPDKFFQEDELHWRIQKNIEGFDLALYGYHGYWKSPAGYDAGQSAYTFPGLDVYGFSLEGSAAGGIVAVETGYYRSKDDADGSDPLIRNGEIRWLIQYRRDLKNHFTAGLQYYNEIMTGYDNFTAARPGKEVRRRVHDLLGLRLRKLVNKQRIELGFVALYSFQNKDIYFRPRATYQIDDFWKIDIGANLFAGRYDTTFWNQFRFNNNLYFGIKWNI